MLCRDALLHVFTGGARCKTPMQMYKHARHYLSSKETRNQLSALLPHLDLCHFSPDLRLSTVAYAGLQKLAQGSLVDDGGVFR